MSPPKHPKDYSIDEVCLWVNAAGLGAKANAFREQGIDGALLVTLTVNDLQDDIDVGLSGLQAKKLMRSLETSKQFAEQGGGGGASLDRINELEAENAALRAQLEEYAPAPAPAPAPRPAPHKPRPAGAPVIRGAAGGATRGAILGAVAGAVAGDPAMGAKIGAATGATGGAMRGIGARRRARMANRF